MKKILSILLTLVTIAGLTSLTVFADDVIKTSRLRITTRSKTVRVDRTLQLEYTISPDDSNDYKDIDWVSSDYDIVDVDEYGECSGISPGTATITIKLVNSNGKTVRSDSVEITVPGKALNPNVVDTDDSTESSSTATVNSSTTTTTPAATKIPTATVTDEVKKVVQKDATKSATFKNYSSVSPATLQAAAQAAKSAGGKVLLNFDTMDGKKVEGRLTIDPSKADNLKKDISLGVNTNDSVTGKTRAKFEKYFKNKVVIIKAAQSGSYGMNVAYAVKIGVLDAKSKNLTLYSYDPVTNKYSTIKNAGLRIDKNNYAHFTTNLGDYLVLSEGVLAKK